MWYKQYKKGFVLPGIEEKLNVTFCCLIQHRNVLSGFINFFNL